MHWLKMLLRCINAVRRVKKRHAHTLCTYVLLYVYVSCINIEYRTLVLLNIIQLPHFKLNSMHFIIQMQIMKIENYRNFQSLITHYN